VPDDASEEIARALLTSAQEGDKNLLHLRTYGLVKPLGRGGNGAVYLLRSEHYNQHIALKLMLPDKADESGAIKVFFREIENAKALSHRNIVKLYQYGHSQQACFFTMEYCDGGSVEKLVSEYRGGSIPLDSAGMIILDALAGLEHAHKATIPYVERADGTSGPGTGLVHRDLKPSNLLVSGVGASRTAKVSDWGLAKVHETAGFSGITRSGPGQAIGSARFMCRQVVEDYKYSGPEVDVWAMAATFYYMLTGSTPREFQAGRDPWHVVLMTKPVPIRQRDPTVPDDLAKLLDRVLDDSRPMHFTSAGEFSVALKAVL
jgi:serine/threonine protein kinase